MVVPKEDFHIVTIPEFFHPVQAPPLIGVDDNQPADLIELDFTGKDNVKGRFMGGKKFGNVVVDRGWYYPHRIRIEHGCPDD